MIALLKSVFDRWVWKMAWRDLRSSFSKMIVIIASLSVGVAAIVSINSFKYNLQDSIQNESKGLLGADFQLSASKVIEDSAFVDLLPKDIRQASEVSLGSMAYAVKNQRSRLVRLKAYEGDFPFYGDFITHPTNAKNEFYKSKYGILADPALIEQFQLNVGDTVKIGGLSFNLLGAIEELAGGGMSLSVIGPRVVVSLDALKETNLIQFGSRVDYDEYYAFTPESNISQADKDSLYKDIRESLEGERVRLSTYESQQSRLGDSIGNLFRFLNLIGFTAILLGVIGVITTIRIYIKSKWRSIAVLRCMGASPARARAVYFTEIALTGLIGAIIGIVFGLAIHLALPAFLADVIPGGFEAVISFKAISIGLVSGVASAMVFMIKPLIELGKVSPLNAIRAGSESETNATRWESLISILVGLLFLFVLSYALLQDVAYAFSATSALLICLCVFWLLAVILIKLARYLRFDKAPFAFRQGIANLYRPNNQTLAACITVGFGVFIIALMYLSQQSLLERLDISTGGEQANFVMLDIQVDQKEGIKQILSEENIELDQEVPMITMKIESIKGQKIADILEDTTYKGRKWPLRREYRSTYRSELTDTETLLEGEFIGEWEAFKEPVPVSAEQDILNDLNLTIGDTLTWNIQGVPLQSVITSSREVEWLGISPNFFFVFPDGVLDDAPQFIVDVARVDDPITKGRIQNKIVQRMPNVSVLDISSMLKQVTELIDKISFVLQFMGGFSLVVGIIVLGGSITAAQKQRLAESALLRTIGATKQTLIGILSIEYIVLALLSMLSGLLLAISASYLVNVYYFEIEAFEGVGSILWGCLLFLALVLGLGLWSSRNIFSTPPLKMYKSLID